VTVGATGYNPYRTSQFLNRQAWVEAGMSPDAATNYLGAIEASLASPNMVLDLRIPQNQRYQQVVLDQAVSQYLAGEIDLDTAVKQIYDGWQEITEFPVARSGRSFTRAPWVSRGEPDLKFKIIT
jgi:multiple sugar transport system substrate-binding protein